MQQKKKTQITSSGNEFYTMNLKDFNKNAFLNDKFKEKIFNFFLVFFRISTIISCSVMDMFSTENTISRRRSILTSR